MSLINEALQRARDEAVRQESIQRGVPLPRPPSSPQRSGWLAITVLILAAALAVSVLALLGLSRQIPQARTGPEPLPTPAVATPADDLVAVLPSPAEPAPQASLTEVPLVAPGTAARAPADPVSGEPTAAAVRESPGDTHAADPARHLPSGEIIRTSRDDSVPVPVAGAPDSSTETYVRHVDLENAVSLELGGIAWSEAGPYALLNGRVVGIGESVSGFIVREIDPLQVFLEGQDRKLVLRLK